MGDSRPKGHTRAIHNIGQEGTGGVLSTAFMNSSISQTAYHSNRTCPSCQHFSIVVLACTYETELKRPRRNLSFARDTIEKQPLPWIYWVCDRCSGYGTAKTLGWELHWMGIIDRSKMHHLCQDRATRTLAQQTSSCTYRSVRPTSPWKNAAGRAVRGFSPRFLGVFGNHI